MTKTANYILSAYSFITTQTVDKLLDVGYESKGGNPIPSFDEKSLIKLCEDAEKLFQSEDNILRIEGDLTIVGDIHGSFHDLLRILNFIEENDSKVLFLGDFVDRGNFSIECVTILFALKIVRPDNFFLIRGNHEFDALCSQYGFKEEILNYHNPKKKKPTMQQKEKVNDNNILSFNFDTDDSSEKVQDDDNQNDGFFDHADMNCYKYTELLYEAFIKAFAFLPIGAIVNQTTFCIHGGLSPRLEKVSQLQYGVIRPVYNFEDNRILSDVLWSDPSSDFSSLFEDNPRGRGFLFSMNVVYNFLSSNSLKRIIRAHQCVRHGTHTQFNEKFITVFSASSYDKDMHNSSGILKIFQKDDIVHSISFPPITRLDKSDAAYYKVQAFNNAKDCKSHICFSFKHPNLNSNYTVRMVTNTANKGIKHHQSLQKPFGIHRTQSRAANPFIHKPVILHSVSMNYFNPKDDMNNEAAKGMTRSIYSFDDISKFE